MPNVKWEDLVAGGAGAVDEALFGIPEFVAKKINREAAEKYIKEHEKAYRTGETIGTVGSMLIPVPGLGLAKGAAAATKGAKAAATGVKALKAADTAADIAKGASAAEKMLKIAPKAQTLGRSVAEFAGRGALSGALESGVRGVTSEKTPEQILQDIQGGAAFGAPGGAAGGALTKGLSSLGKVRPQTGNTFFEDLAGEASKVRKQYSLGSAGFTKKYAKQIAKDFSGPGAKGLGRFAKADDALTRAAEIIDSEGLAKMGADDRYFGQVSKHWQQMNDVTEKALGDTSGENLFNLAFNKGSKEIQSIAKSGSGKKVEDQLLRLMGEAKDYEGINNFKKFLDNEFTDTFRQNVYQKASDAEAARDAVSIIRRNLDEIITDVAEKSGMDKAIIDKRRANYIFDRGIAQAFADDIFSPKTTGGGSQTAMRLGTALALGGGGYLSGENDDEKLKRALGGVALAAGGDILGGMLNRAQAKAVTSLVSKGAPLAEALERAAPKAAAALENLSPAYGAQVGGEFVAQKAREAAAPTTPGEEEAVQVASAAGTDQKKYMDIIRDKMVAYAESLGVPEDSDNFREFAAQVYAMTDGFSPDKIGGILYQDPEERKAYETALRVARGLKEEERALNRPGLFSGESDEERLAREASVDKLAALVEDVGKAKGVGPQAKKAAQKILSGGEDPARKQELLGVLLEQYGVNLDELSALGVV